MSETSFQRKLSLLSHIHTNQEEDRQRERTSKRERERETAIEREAKENGGWRHLGMQDELLIGISVGMLLEDLWLDAISALGAMRTSSSIQRFEVDRQRCRDEEGDMEDYRIANFTNEERKKSVN